MLWVFAVPNDGSRAGRIGRLKTEFQQAIRAHLNPLFKIHELTVIEGLPRTASHKIMRRVLRDEAVRLINGGKFPADGLSGRGFSVRRAERPIRLSPNCSSTAAYNGCRLATISNI